MKLVVLALVLVGCTKKGGDNASKSEPANTTGGNPGSTIGGDGTPRPTEVMPPVTKRGREIVFDFEGTGMEAMGAVDKDTVRKVVKENVTKLQQCYEQTLMANPEIAGTVTATFTVDNGSISNIKAAGVHPDVEACVVKAVQLFKFPPGGKVEVTYPFIFKPAS